MPNVHVEDEGDLSFRNLSSVSIERAASRIRDLRLSPPDPPTPLNCRSLNPSLKGFDEPVQIGPVELSSQNEFEEGTTHD